MPTGKRFDDEEKYEFLVKLRQLGKPTQAARACGWSYSTITEARKNDPAFKEDLEDSIAFYEDNIRQEIISAMYERGVVGWKEPLVDRHGNIVGHKDKFSERCLIKLAERWMPEFRTNNPTVDVNINAGVLAVPTTSEKDPQKALEEWSTQYTEFEVEPLEGEEDAV